MHKAQENSKNTRDENIYIYWGLHFTSIVPGVSTEASSLVVFSKIMDSLEMWKTKLEKTKIPEHKKAITNIIDWLSRLLARNFKKEVMKYVYKN